MLRYLNSLGKKIPANILRRDIQNSCDALNIRLLKRISTFQFGRKLRKAYIRSLCELILSIILFAHKTEKCCIVKPCHLEYLLS